MGGGGPGYAYAPDHVTAPPLQISGNRTSLSNKKMIKNKRKGINLKSETKIPYWLKWENFSDFPVLLCLTFSNKMLKPPQSVVAYING